MPAIRSYENQVSLKDTLNPQTAVNAGNALLQASRVAADAAETKGKIGGVIGEGIKDLGETYQDFRAQQEISHGLATNSQIFANTTESWNNTAKNADPNDPATAEKWREEELEPVLQAWASGFETKRGKAWAEAQVGSVRNHFYEKTAADQATMAGSAAVKNLRTFIDNATRTVQGDPSTTTLMLGTVGTALDATLAANPNLTVGQQTQIRDELEPAWKKEVTLAAGQSIARGNPELAQKMIADGTLPGNEHLDAGDREKLFGFAATIKNAQDADAKAAAVAARKAQEDDFDKKATAIAATMYNPDGTLSIKAGTFQALTDLSQHPGAKRADIQALQNAMASATTDAINGTYRFSDPATYQSLASRIGVPKGSPNALQAAEVDKAYTKLAPSDYRYLRQAAVSEAEGSGADPADKASTAALNAALERVKPLITKSTMFRIDQSGVANYDAFYYDTHQRFAALKAQGKTPAEAAAILTDPRNPEGIQNSMAPYQTNNKQAMANLRARTSQAGGPTGPTRVQVPAGQERKPGETPEAYLKRMAAGGGPAPAPKKPAGTHVYSGVD